MCSGSKGVVKALLVQLLCTEIVSILGFGILRDQWLAGAIAPLWGLMVPVGIVLSRGSPITQQLVLPTIVLVGAIALIVIAVKRYVHRFWGHGALFIANALSAALLAGLE